MKPYYQDKNQSRYTADIGGHEVILRVNWIPQPKLDI